MERKTIKIKVEVDTREIDKAVKKIEYLNKQLNEAAKKLKYDVKVELTNGVDTKEIAVAVKQSINEMLEGFKNTTISNI